MKVHTSLARGREISTTLIGAVFGIALLGFFSVGAIVNKVSAQAPTEKARQMLREGITKLPPKEKRWALIIGVDKYDDTGITPLRGAANDARILQTALRDHAGFPADQIILLATDEPRERQPTRVNIMRRLSNLRGLVPPDGLLLVSFSGHGIDRNGNAFLVPSDAAFTEDISLLEETALSVTRIQSQIRATGVGQVLVLLDACRNDPAGGKSDSANPLTEAYLKGFRFDERNKDIQAFATLYATSVGTRAYEYSEKQQGYFTWALAEGLSGKAADPRTGEVTLGSLVSYIETAVPRQVALDFGPTKKQRPFAVIEGYRADALVLSMGKKTLPPSEPVGNINPRDVTAGETAFWETIKSSSDCKDYEAFLDAYPGSTYAAAARFKIGKLCAVPRQQNADVTPVKPISPPVATNTTESYAGSRNQQKAWIGLIVKNDLKQVIEQTSKSIESNKQDLFAYRMRAVAHFMSNDGEKGKKDASMLLDLTAAAADADHFEARCYAYFTLFKLDDALVECNKAIDKNPGSATALATRGYVFQAKREFDKAIQDFRQAIKVDTDFSWLHRDIGVTYYSKKNLELSLIEFNKAIEFNPEIEDFYIKRAIVYSDTKEFEKAILDLNRVVQLNPKSLIGFFNRGLTHNTIQKYDLAIADFTRAAELEPFDARPYFNRSISYTKKALFREAIADLTKAIQINPESGILFTNRGDNYFWINDGASALRDYNEAIRLEPRDSTAYFGIGRVLNRQSEYSRAIDAYSNAIAFNAEYTQAYIERGFMYYIKSKYDLAFADFAKAIELAPNYSDPYNRRALIHLWKRDFDKAIADLDQAIKLWPGFGWAYTNRCEAYHGKKEYDRAISDCSKAIELEPKLFGPYRQRAKAYEAKGNNVAAAADRKKADELEKAAK